MAAIRKILIVGGGTAGWLTAAYLAKTLGAGQPDGVQIELVESSSIGILGVGEGTFPSIKGTLAAIGVDEASFLRGALGTFKQGIKYAHWVRPPGAQGADHYFHPFNQPSQKPGAPELLPYWLEGMAGPGTSFAEAVTMQKRTADAARGPKRLTDADFLGPFNYAYHFDAAHFARFLSEQAQRLGVTHHIATIDRVVLEEDGAIAALETGEAGTLTADLYIDCSGLRGALIDGALGSRLHSLSDTLFVDRAVAIQVPYERPDAPIASYTIATAHEAGWSWDIGLRERRGTGYVYSSRHTDDTRAEAVLRAHIGKPADNQPARLLKFETGYRPLQWVKNCVAVGLAGGFLEPLESTGIGLIETGAYLIGHLFPFDGNLAPAARRFNELMVARYERIIDFLKLHYCLTQRRDSAFWIDNTDPAGIPDTLKDRLAAWRSRPPHRLDFVTDIEMFLPASWQFILYGMEFRTDLGAGRAVLRQADAARKEFQAIHQVSELALADLPSHRALVEAFYARAAARAA